ncbi:MAG: phytase [Phycisphaerales bacterium]
MITFVACGVLFLPGVSRAPVDPPGLAVVQARTETERVDHAKDALDDPAVWVHPARPEQSLILGANKRGGLIVYGLDGAVRQTLAPDRRFNNVDVVQGTLPGGSAERFDIIFASDRTDDSVAVFSVVGGDGQVVPLVGASFSAGMRDVYGLCSYLDPADGLPRVVVNNKHGTVRVFSMSRGASGGWETAKLVREFSVGGQVEGCVADPAHGWLYIGEETVGVWRYPLDAASERPRELLDLVRSPIGGRLAADVEGITLYQTTSTEGWIIVSCQSEDRFAVYDRVTGRYAGSFAVSLRLPDGSTDLVTHTDGICAVNSPLGPNFPRGVFVAQDDNGGVRQNFKIVDWREIQSVLTGDVGGASR